MFQNEGKTSPELRALGIQLGFLGSKPDLRWTACSNSPKLLCSCNTSCFQDLLQPSRTEELFSKLHYQQCVFRCLKQELKRTIYEQEIQSLWLIMQHVLDSQCSARQHPVAQNLLEKDNYLQNNFK